MTEKICYKTTQFHSSEVGGGLCIVHWGQMYKQATSTSVSVLLL